MSEFSAEYLILKAENKKEVKVLDLGKYGSSARNRSNGLVQVKGRNQSYWNWDAKQTFVLRNKAKVQWQQIRTKSDKVQLDIKFLGLPVMISGLEAT